MQLAHCMLIYLSYDLNLSHSFPQLSRLSELTLKGFKGIRAMTDLSIAVSCIAYD